MKNIIAALFLLLLSQSCSQQNTTDNAQSSGQLAAQSENQAQVKYAEGFSIAYFEDYKLVTIKGAGSQSEEFVLLSEGQAAPKDYQNAQIIRIPVKSMVAMSSMHIGLLSFLNAENVLAGLGSLQYVYSPKVLEMIDAGKIAEVGKDNGLNQEKLVELHPDLIMTVGSPGGKAEHYAILKQAGIPVLANSEWMETTPLARAEWVKLAAALLNKEKEANQKFAQIETKYNSLRDLAEKVKRKPTVITGLNMKDIWFLSAGRNYMSRFLQDAGANYEWDDTEGNGSLSLSFETVYPHALKAEYWVNVGFGKDDTKQSILAQDARYKDFAASKSGKMYNYNSRVNAQGSNDFFESGTVNPDKVLADLISIFHPEILPGHELVYYQKLP